VPTLDRPTLADVLRAHGPTYLRTHSLNTQQAKAWRAICACRTPALGGQCMACSDCGHSHWQYHSCRNRHCPTCGARAKDAWLQARLSQVLDVPYTHLVFALPHEFNALYRLQPKAVIEALFASVQQTLHEFAANPCWMGITDGQAAFTLVLHTWSQDLGLHVHLHAIMACGVLGRGQWHAPVRKSDYLFPTRALSKVWRAKFMAKLRQSTAPAKPEPSHAAMPWAMNPQQRQTLWKKDWVVYAKTPLGGAAQVLAYLSRYTHRTALGNERIKAITAQEVVFSARAKGQAGEQGQKRRLRIPGPEFIGRFVQHILPSGLKRIRHYGLLANPSGQQLACAKAALKMPAPNPQAKECAQDFMARVARVNLQQCPACEHGRLRVMQTRPGLKRLPDPMALGQAGKGQHRQQGRTPPAQGP
jgi:hypothetical protein